MGRFQRVAGSLPKPTCEGLQITSIIFQGEGAALALRQMLDESVNSRTGAASGIHVIRPVFLSLIEENAWGYTLSGSECQRKSKIIRRVGRSPIALDRLSVPMIVMARNGAAGSTKGLCKIKLSQ